MTAQPRLNLVFARAMGLAWPLQVAVVAGWIAVPHPAGSHPLALAVITLAALPLYLPLLVMRRPKLTRTGTNIAMVFGVAQMCAMVWAGGGLASGFELMPLWFVPVTVCLVPTVDVIVEMLLVIAGAGVGAVLANHSGLSFTESSMWGFSLMAIATLLITSGATGYVHSELQAVSERFRRRSVQDPLTGLSNRAALSSFISETVADRSPGTAFVIDIDGFKLINDSLGHHAGDVLLSLLADRLRSHARSGDLLARAGGDEFVLIARGVDDSQEALILGERLLEVCAQPFVLDGMEAHLSVTVGAAPLGDPATVEESLRNADLALYAAKSERRGTARLFEAAMREQAVSRVSTEHHLRRAMERGELRLVYQPIVSLDTCSTTCLEALVRWRSPELGDVSPVDFIPVAERTGLILPIGRFVLAEAIGRIGEWRGRGHDVRISVNLSAGQLADERLPEFIVKLLDRHRVPANALWLELTESSLMEHAGEQPLALLDHLRATGVQLALDDFGTGYSSLSRLSSLRLSAVKVDRSFVHRMLADATAEAVVSAVVRMSEAMGIDVVAEGVERPEQVARLAELGCGYGQGFLFARPLEAEAVEPLLDGSSSRASIAA
jgi:diguanylate cyclase (GGDEF)-like protein